LAALCRRLAEVFSRLSVDSLEYFPTAPSCDKNKSVSFAWLSCSFMPEEYGAAPSWALEIVGLTEVLQPHVEA